MKFSTVTFQIGRMVETCVDFVKLNQKLSADEISGFKLSFNLKVREF